MCFPERYEQKMLVFLNPFQRNQEKGATYFVNIFRADPKEKCILISTRALRGIRDKDVI